MWMNAHEVSTCVKEMLCAKTRKVPTNALAHRDSESARVNVPAQVCIYTLALRKYVVEFNTYTSWQPVL